MATKYVCDRCEREVNDQSKLSTVKIGEVGDQYPTTLGEYCYICTNHIKSAAKDFVTEEKKKMKINTFEVDSYSVTFHNGTIYISFLADGISQGERIDIELNEEERKNLILQLRQPTDEIK